MGKAEFFDILKRVAKAVIVVGVTGATDTMINNNYYLKPSNSVDAFLRHVGTCAVGLVAGDKAADYLIRKAEQLYHEFEEARD